MSFKAGKSIESLDRARKFIAALSANGIHYFFYSPGFRNSPLIVAARERSDLTVKSFIDERVAAFAALGASRQSGRPIAVCTTSGSALGNLLPAIMEADKSSAPVIMVTADRPEALRFSGANQTTNQIGIFSNFVRDEINLSTSDTALPSIDWQNRLGPVHVNIEFSEPLLPSEPEKAPPLLELDLQQHETECESQAIDFSGIKDTLDGLDRVGISLGYGPYSERELRAVFDLADSLNAPLFAEPSSGWVAITSLREYSGLVWDLDRDDSLEFVKRNCDGIIHFGGATVSRNWTDFIGENDRLKLLLVDNFIPQRNPFIREGVMVATDTFSAVRLLKESLRPWRLPITNEVRDNMLALIEDRQTRLAQESELTSIMAWDLIFKALPKAMGPLFIGNSTVIRDFNKTCYSLPQAAQIIINRGLSGIDGNLATALGAFLSSGKLTVAVTGDLAFFHDCGALLEIKDKGANLKIIVLNNSGGEIFRRVGTRKYPEDVFCTPRNQSAAKVATAYDIPNASVPSKLSLQDALETLFRTEGPGLLEVMLSDSNCPTP